MFDTAVQEAFTVAVMVDGSVEVRPRDGFTDEHVSAMVETLRCVYGVLSKGTRVTS